MKNNPQRMCEIWSAARSRLQEEGADGHWWDVAVLEVSARQEVRDARKAYEKQTALQRAD